MKAWHFLSTVALLFLSAIASAQSYSVRVTYNTNLRASYSRQARIVDKALAGTTVAVAGSHENWLKIDWQGRAAWMADWVPLTRVQSETVAADVNNCCFVDRQCATDQEWTDGYWAHQNNQCGAPTQTQETVVERPVSSTPTNVNNCCFVDRQCATDQEWTDGYWAYQNNQCGAPAGTRQSSTAPIGDASDVDNCCYLDWLCNSDADWQRGFYARQANQCEHGGLRIEGSPGFTFQVELGLDMLKNRAPKWYGYVISALELVKQTKPPIIGVDVAARVFSLSNGDEFPPAHDQERFAGYMAAVLIHESCHVHRYQAGLQSGGLPGETACVETEVVALSEFAPNNPHLNSSRRLLTHIHRPECQWWHGAYETCYD